ncbi:Histidinol-phosphate aminotransferase 2 [Variovorax sp. SRS16]|uniref:aminotransferase class I/II-fold pyridoxal phosphate-dependent enzyme n=1 Tax=Variovorax sp. SRS16 TaxID=282217 RepID=UPI001316F025|nr:aminotransferase class I/II-fold pyridoxal phosphate-dependent enzyme [Variovorax sp. SRS16]VTU19342.1 Histidinol-phosphate aminotransferase 2 [Variovorax sp. SRS16]
MSEFDEAGLVHGGPDARGAAPHDFSTNGNACGPCPDALDALQAADAARYPDPHYTALRARLAAFHGVEDERILIAASASEFIARISAAVAQQGGRRAWLPSYSYGDCLRAARAWGLSAQCAPSPSADADLVWCCDPSSPLGQAQDGLQGVIDALPAQAVCVLDLAYEPLRLEGRLGLGAAQKARVWQLWTPNKALGLTGVRAAYAIAPAGEEGMRARLDRLAPSWPLGAHGVALLAAWTEEDTQAWLRHSLAQLRHWKAEQQAMCTALGWTCLPSVANFFCARPDTSHAARAAALRDAGVQLRDTASFGLPDHVRLGVLPPASQRALRHAWTAERRGSAPGTP